MTSSVLAWIEAELDRLEQHGLLRQSSERQGPQGAWVQWNGRRLINFGSNDYLGLASQLDGRLRDAPESGWGSGASPLVTGRSTWHATLEQRLAEFEGSEAALLFSSGYAANVGCLTALAGRGDVIFSDARNHASIVDGCRLSGAHIAIYPHADVTELARLLRDTHAPRRRLIVSDTLFSMDGDLAPLAELAELAKQFNAMLVVDEAHATGVFGTSGRGVCESLGIEDPHIVRVGTLSKALGSLGGFVAGPASVIRWLANRARPYFFSTAMPDSVAAAGLQALDIVQAEPGRRRQLLSRAAALRDALRGRGWNLGRSQSQIIPLIVGLPQRAMELAAELQHAGLLVPGIRPPSVPENHALLRISLTYHHTEEHCQQLLATLDELTRDSGRQQRT